MRVDILVLEKTKLLHLELYGQLGDVVNEEGERGHEAQSGQVNESQSRG